MERSEKLLGKAIGRVTTYGLIDAECDLSSARGTLEDAISGCIHHVSSLEKCIEQLSEGLSSLLEAYILLKLHYMVAAQFLEAFIDLSFIFRGGSALLR